MKIISLLALSIGMAMAQTNELHYDVLRTLDGQTISNATVKPMNAAYVVVLTETGGEKIAFTNLSSDVQRQFDYDPARAQAELDLQERRKLEAQERFEAQAKARADAEKDRLFRIVGDNIYPVSSFHNLHGKVFEVLGNGVVLQLYDHVAQQHHYSGIGTGNGGAGGFMGGGGSGGYTTYLDMLNGNMAFVKCPIRGMAEGQDWTGLCLRQGTFSYNGQVLERYDTGLSCISKSDVVLHGSSTTAARRPPSQLPESN